LLGARSRDMTALTTSYATGKSIAHRLGARIVGLAQLGLLALVAVLIAGTLGGRSAVLDLFSHFQMQYATCALLALLVMLLARRWWWGLLAAVLLVFCAARIAPMYVPGPVYAHGEQRDLRLLLMNIQRDNRRFDLIRETVVSYDPDIIIVQELASQAMRELHALTSEHRYRLIRTREDHFGIGLMSRVPLTRTEIVEVGPSGVPSLHVGLELKGESIELLTTHPLPPIPVSNTPSRNAQLTDVGRRMQKMMKRSPAILIGDLNVTPWSPNWDRLFGDQPFHNARRGFGVLPTWSMHHPFVLRIAIDHCLVSEQWRVVHCATGPDIGSDHLPLIVDLALSDEEPVSK